MDNSNEHIFLHKDGSKTTEQKIIEIVNWYNTSIHGWGTADTNDKLSLNSNTKPYYRTHSYDTVPYGTYIWEDPFTT